MPDELSDFAKELIQRCPALINRFAEKINSMIYNWDPNDTDRKEVLKPVEIVKQELYGELEIQDLLQHVGYDAAQCGYDK